MKNISIFIFFCLFVFVQTSCRKQQYKDNATSSNTSTVATQLDNTEQTTKQELSNLLNLYYALKNALIADNGTLASQKAGEFVKAISTVKMDKMNTEQHSVWMKYTDKLKTHAEYISQTKEVEKQREHLNELSNNLWEVMKAFKINDKTAYQQYCPMKKTYWISSEKDIKNPYYGNQMLTCGKVTATLE